MAFGYYLIHQLKKGIREEVEDAVFHAEWDKEMTDWRERRDAFELLRKEEEQLWNAGKREAAYDVRVKADRLYPDFAAEEEETHREMDELTQRSLRGESLPEPPPRVPVDVWFDGRRWRARIRVNGKNVFLGRFRSEAAAKAARNAAGEKHGVEHVAYRVSI